MKKNYLTIVLSGALFTGTGTAMAESVNIGAPAWTGAWLQFVNTYGVDKFVARATELAALYGDRFNPPKLLLDKAANGELFVD